MRATLWLLSHEFLLMGVNLGSIHLNVRLTQGLGPSGGGLAHGGLEAPKGDLCAVFLPIPFR